MFKDAGKFIKFLATVAFVINILIAIVLSVYLGFSLSQLTVMPVCIAAGILVFGVSICISYVECTFIYGYGDLIDNTKEIRRLLSQNARNFRDSIEG